MIRSVNILIAGTLLFFFSISCQPKEERKMSMKMEISGMHCNGCASTIENTLKEMKGVYSAHASFDSAYATVMFDSNRVSAPELIKAIEKKGYKVEKSGLMK